MAPPANPPERFWTVAEVADLLRVSRMTVYRMVHASELRALQVGRNLRIPEAAVHDYIQGAYITPEG